MPIVRLDEGSRGKPANPAGILIMPVFNDEGYDQDTEWVMCRSAVGVETSSGYFVERKDKFSADG